MFTALEINVKGLLMSAKNKKVFRRQSMIEYKKQYLLVITCMTKMKNSNALKFHKSKIFSSDGKENIY